MVKLLRHLRDSRQRQLVLLEGERNWCDERLGELRAGWPEWRLFSNRSNLAGACSPSTAERYLGSETDGVLLDVFQGYDPDLLCIAAGLVRAGGVLVVLAPPSVHWDAEADDFACWQDGERSTRPIFAEWFGAAIAQDPQIGLLLTAEARLPVLPSMPTLAATPLDNGCTADQRQVLGRIDDWLARDETGVVLIEAARGRGKSTCLGLLCERLAGRLTCLVSAPSRAAARLALVTAPSVPFAAPDRLLLERPPADLLLVDEAAMIPQAILLQLCRHYPRVVLTTTSDGYEGTGQGFRLRFVDRFDSGRLLRLSLAAPVRWCTGDLLENWLERTLLPRPVALPAEVRNGRFRVEVFDRSQQALDQERLREVFALLSSAHYRTRPSDLRMLMENPGLVILLAVVEQQLVGAALLNTEGGFDADLCEAVFFGRRRPRGHLLAQMMTAQAGLREFARHRGLRVQRIAVDTDLRRRGIGRALLEHARQYAEQQRCAYLGASFALEPENAEFWRATGFELAHVSFAAGKSSGNQSVVVLQLLGDALRPGLDAQRARIQRQLPVWLLQFLRLLDYRQVVTLLRLAKYRYAPAPIERDDLEAFVHGERGFERCFASLQPQIMHAIASGNTELDPLVIEKGVLDRPWKQLPRAAGDEGRKQLQRRLRRLVDDLVNPC